MNLRIVGRYIGLLLLAEAAFLLPSALVAALYAEWRVMSALLITALLCAAAGAGLRLLGKKQAGGLYAREGFVVAGGGWLVISLFGALPFFISGEIPHFIDALFESISGFTTTGASLLPHIDRMSHGLVFWRSFTHWLGGIGVLAFVLLLVRAQKGAGFTMHLLRAETPGPQVDKMLPKMRDSIRTLYIIYLSLSALNLLLLLAGRMPLFDALCTMFGTAGTGGFGIAPDSMASYSPYLQTVTAIFMILFGVNFSLYYLLFRRDFRTVARNEELRLYLCIILISVVLITVNVAPQFPSVREAIHHVFFTVGSVITTTGYSTVNFDLWPQFSHTTLLLLMIIGSMAGSTGGGIKVSRVLILAKSIRAHIYRLLHPRSVKSVHLNGKKVDDVVVKNVYFFMLVYAAIALVSFWLVSLDNLPMETNFSAVLACFNNVGPGFGIVGPAHTFAGYSYLSKMVLAGNMLLGRLEIFPILLLLVPGTWSKKT